MSYIVKPPCDEAVIQSAPVHDDSKELKRTTRAELSTSAKSTGRWVLVATILGSSMAFIDGTVVNVALPVLQTELHATATDVQWVVEAYSLFLAALILVGGSLGDHFGRRRVFAIGIVLFTVASVLCGLAPKGLRPQASIMQFLVQPGSSPSPSLASWSWPSSATVWLVTCLCCISLLAYNRLCFCKRTNWWASRFLLA